MKSKVKRQFGNNEYKSRHQLKRKQRKLVKPETGALKTNKINAPLLRLIKQKKGWRNLLPIPKMRAITHNIIMNTCM